MRKQMQIVINIDNDLYKSIIGHRYKNTHQQKCDYEDLINAIEDGVPLPKSHGRLIDADAINLKDISPVDGFSIYGATAEDIDLTPTVLEAESEVHDACGN